MGGDKYLFRKILVVVLIAVAVGTFSVIMFEAVNFIANINDFSKYSNNAYVKRIILPTSFANAPHIMANGKIYITGTVTIGKKSVETKSNNFASIIVFVGGVLGALSSWSLRKSSAPERIAKFIVNISCKLKANQPSFSVFLLINAAINKNYRDDYLNDLADMLNDSPHPTRDKLHLIFIGVPASLIARVYYWAREKFAHSRVGD